MHRHRYNQESIYIAYNPESLTKERDPLGLQKARLVNQMKQADHDNLAYEKSKAELYGVMGTISPVFALAIVHCLRTS
jgi:hypothetical protein